MGKQWFEYRILSVFPRGDKSGEPWLFEIIWGHRWARNTVRLFLKRLNHGSRIDMIEVNKHKARVNGFAVSDDDLHWKVVLTQ